MLASARKEYAQQQRLAALAVNEAQRIATRGSLVIARSVQTYQAASVAASLEALRPILDEQGIAADAEAAVVPTALLTDTAGATTMINAAQDERALLRLVQTMVTDAARTTRAVDQTTRPAVTRYVRSLNPPSCGRCAVLAGRIYRYSTGFQRHPRCDCLMTPTNEVVGRELITDPMDLFRAGQIRGLSKADTEAINLGADLGKVVNVQRSQAGLRSNSSVMVRRGRLTPEGCLTIGSDRAERLALLRKHGYIT